MYTSAPQDVQTLQQQQQNHRQNTFDFLNSRDCVHNGRFGVESNWTVSLVPNPGKSFPRSLKSHIFSNTTPFSVTSSYNKMPRRRDLVNDA